MTKRIQVWSCGGGTQSAAIAALICKGELKPDLSVIVDTEREVQQTWDYYDNVLVPNLAKVGVTLHRVKKSDYATVDLYGGAEKDTLLIPAFTTQKGTTGKLPSYCSSEWKMRVVQRWCNHVMPDAEGFDMWLGISRDEYDRMKARGTGKWQYYHPLIEDGRTLNRVECYSLVRSMGWPQPPKSRCWMCPNQTNHEWNDLEKNHPNDYAKAMDFQTEIQKKDPHVKLRGDGDNDCMSGMCFI